MAFVRKADRCVVALDFEHVLERDGNAVHWTKRGVSDTTVRTRYCDRARTSDETHEYR